MTSGGNNFHIWHSSELASLRHRISHHKFELFVTISYESASGGPSDPSLGVENCNLHSNSIMTHPSRFHLGVDMIELPCKLQFLTRSKGAEMSLLADL